MDEKTREQVQRAFAVLAGLLAVIACLLLTLIGVLRDSDVLVSTGGFGAALAVLVAVIFTVPGLRG